MAWLAINRTLVSNKEPNNLILINSLSILLAIVLIIAISCGNGDYRKVNSTKAPTHLPPLEDTTIKRVVFFIENSGSMNGYVNQTGEFKSTLVNLAYLPAFDDSQKNFYFINGTSIPGKGSSIKINPIGNNPELLRDKLNSNSFYCGDTRYSDLKKMFEVALDSVKGNQITILVTDCIYDVGEENDPLTALKIETQSTQQIFRKRLGKEDIETIIIKAYSKFDGNYYFASKGGSQQVNNSIRPYYILIFGKTELLNMYITDKLLEKKIEGNFEIARFFKIENGISQFRITPKNKIGDSRIDYRNKYKLIDATSDRNGKGFQFSIAVDLRKLPFSETYKSTIDNYECLNSAYSLKSVDKYKTNEIPGITGTHLITVFTDKNPVGIIEIIFNNNLPDWIDKTNSDTENRIDQTHTYGFTALTNAISEAYAFVNQGKELASFKIEITR